MNELVTNMAMLMMLFSFLDINIRITKDISEANAITHSGRFHADEIMATYILAKIFPELVVYRTNKVPNDAPKSAIIYDIGYGPFDHHQDGGNGVRYNNVPYSSCGLIWKKFGNQIVAHVPDPTYVWKNIDHDLIQGIDAIDNGVAPKLTFPAPIMSFSGSISAFNPTWDSPQSSDEAFLRAVAYAGITFENVFDASVSSAKAYPIIEEAIEKSENHIMVLEKYVPWQDFLFSSENQKANDIWFVIFPSLREGYNWYCVTDVTGEKTHRKPVPLSWRGLRDEALQKETNVETAIFCHKDGFIGGARTLEDTIKMALIAVNS